jgi:hypothetical protein
LLEYAAAVFDLSSEMQDGTTKGAHLRQAAKTAEALGLEVPAGVDEGTLQHRLPPAGFEFLWEAFLDLSTARGTGFGPSPIAYADVLAWCQLYHVRLRAWELDVIRKLDALWLQVAIKTRRSQETKEPEQKDKTPDA